MTDRGLSRTDLVVRLAEGEAAGVTVVTPNRRLAQVLKAEFDAFQAARGLAAWEDADILPLEAFVARCHEEALYAGGGKAGAALPALLSPAQSRALWEEAIRASRWAGALLDAPRTAADAMEAWRLAQAWGIAGALERFPGTEDTRAFADWALAYARRLEKGGWTDAALLPGLDLSGGFRAPRQVVAYAFDVLAPQAAAFLRRFEFRTCEPERKTPARLCRTSFASPREEIEAAARWARARLEEAVAAGRTPRIGVVLPDLGLRRREAARVFSRVLAPGFNEPGAPPEALAFELSLGEPLAGHPPVAFALALLQFTQRPLPFEEASRLLRSPFLGGAEGERTARAQLDARLRRDAPAEMSLAWLIGRLDACPGLRERLERVFALQAEAASPAAWARHFTAVLEAAGFPGERGADSAEHQARERFNELLGEFARLGAVSARLSAGEALRQLRRLCADTLFQPEGAGAPVLVMGLIESAGLAFDALWVSGLTDTAWPQRVRPQPFLPLALQRKAGIPEASAEASFALDRARTEGWAAAADEVVFSWARREEDRELSPSPLIAAIPEGEIVLPAELAWRDLVFAAGRLEAFTDERAPALAAKAVRGGSAVLRDQSACPFRAFAQQRLGARALQSPEPGLDAISRGNLLHAAMKALWDELGSSAALAGDNAPAVALAITRAAAAAVAELGLEGRFAELEKQRLGRLMRAWLAEEAKRPPFEVVKTEDKRTLEIGPLVLEGRIDRMDRLESGGHALIDYKTGAHVTPNDWQKDRLADPQLPLYAVTAKEDIAALAFAKLRAGDMKFLGFSAAKGVIPGVKPALDWGNLMKAWKANLEELAGGFAAGEARVDPRDGLATCRHCDLQPFCRVHERLSALGDEGEGE